MRQGSEPKLRPRMRQAVEELKGLVREHYPDATFQVARSPEEPGTVHLLTTIDREDLDEVLDPIVERIVELQTDERLPIHVIPMQPPERVLAMLREKEAAKARRTEPLPVS